MQPDRIPAALRIPHSGREATALALAHNPAAIARMVARGWRMLTYRSDYDGSLRYTLRAPRGSHPPGLDWRSCRASDTLSAAWSRARAAYLREHPEPRLPGRRSAIGVSLEARRPAPAPAPAPSAPDSVLSDAERAAMLARLPVLAPGAPDPSAARMVPERPGRACDDCGAGAIMVRAGRAYCYACDPETDPEPPEHARSAFGRAAREPSAPDRLAEDWRAAARERARLFRPERRPLPESERRAAILALGTSEPAVRSLARLLAPLAGLESAAGLGGAPLAAPLWDRIERAERACSETLRVAPGGARGRAAADALAFYRAAQSAADRTGALRVALYILAGASPDNRPEHYRETVARYHAAASAWDAAASAYDSAADSIARLAGREDTLPEYGPRPSALCAAERLRQGPRIARLRARAESADRIGADTLRACRADPETGPLSDARPWIERAARIRGAIVRHTAPEQPAERAARALADAIETAAPAGGSAWVAVETLNPEDRPAGWYPIGNPHKGPGALRRARAECEALRADPVFRSRPVRIVLIMEAYKGRESARGGR